jgi:hypothetical protein
MTKKNQKFQYPKAVEIAIEVYQFVERKIDKIQPQRRDL